jgi:hypothetical protein
LSQCRDEETRKSFLKTAGAGGPLLVKKDESRKLVASIPLSFLNWEGYSTKSGFPFDARTINGIIQIQVNWRPTIDYIMCQMRSTSNVKNAVKGNDVLPAVTAFSDIRVSFRSYQLMDSAFSVGNALAADPSMRYTIPAKWLNSYRYQINLESGGAGKPAADGGINGLLSGRIELTSAPAGMLQGIMLHVRPIEVVDAAGGAINADETGNGAIWGPGATRVNRQGSLRLASVNLQYSGQNIIQLRNEEELDSYMRYCYGDDMKTRVKTVWGTRGATDGSNPKSLFKPQIHGLPVEVEYAAQAAAANIAVGRGPNSNHDVGIEIEHQTYVLPLMHNGCDVMRKRHFENLPQYSGSALTLEFDVLNKSTYYADRAPATPGSAAAGSNFNTDGGQALGGGPAPANGNIVFGGESLPPNCPVKYGPMWDSETHHKNDGMLANYYYKRVEVTVTYIIAALVQNSGGMVELQI